MVGYEETRKRRETQLHGHPDSRSRAFVQPLGLLVGVGHDPKIEHERSLNQSFSRGLGISWFFRAAHTIHRPHPVRALHAVDAL